MQQQATFDQKPSSSSRKRSAPKQQVDPSSSAAPPPKEKKARSAAQQASAQRLKEVNAIAKSNWEKSHPDKAQRPGKLKEFRSAEWAKLRAEKERAAGGATTTPAKTKSKK